MVSIKKKNFRLYSYEIGSSKFIKDRALELFSLSLEMCRRHNNKAFSSAL